jgi:4-hydroxy-tetrahydrodipicolinate reductase
MRLSKESFVPIRVLPVGLGPIGAGIVRQIAARKAFRLVGAVDVDEAKAGRDLGDICGLGRKLRIPVTPDITRTIRATRPDVAILCTSSSLAGVVPEFEAVLRQKVPIVSTTEEPIPSHRFRQFRQIFIKIKRVIKIAEIQLTPAS